MDFQNSINSKLNNNNQNKINFSFCCKSLSLSISYTIWNAIESLQSSVCVNKNSTYSSKFHSFRIIFMIESQLLQDWAWIPIISVFLSLNFINSSKSFLLPKFSSFDWLMSSLFIKIPISILFKIISCLKRENKPFLLFKTRLNELMENRFSF